MASECEDAIRVIHVNQDCSVIIQNQDKDILFQCCMAVNNPASILLPAVLPTDAAPQNPGTDTDCRPDDG